MHDKPQIQNKKIAQKVGDILPEVKKPTEDSEETQRKMQLLEEEVKDFRQ